MITRGKLYYVKHRETILQNLREKTLLKREFKVNSLKMELALTSRLEKTITPNEVYAYLGGIIDGEGSVELSFKRKECVLVPRIEISSTSTTLLEWCASVLETKYREDKWGRKVQWKRKYRIVISKQEKIAKALIKVLPYLKIKRRQAELLIKFCLNRLLSGRTPYTEEDYQLFNRIKELNMRGDTFEGRDTR